MLRVWAAPPCANAAALCALVFCLSISVSCASSSPRERSSASRSAHALDALDALAPAAAPLPQEPEESARMPADAEASSPPPAASRWTIELRPYLWVPAMHGQLTVRGTSTPVAVNTGEAFDLLKDLDSAFVLHGELGLDRFRLFGDLYYLHFEEGEATAVGRIDAELTQALTEVGAAYELVQEDLGEGWQLRAAPLAGARIQYLDAKVELRGSGQRFSGDQTWVDAFGGLRFRVGQEQGLGIVGRFDAGGGGSDATWNALAGVDWSIANWLALSAGYRWLSIDYSTGSGRSRFEYDVLLLGPFVGLTLRF